jgi:hypothetical protein
MPQEEYVALVKVNLYIGDTSKDLIIQDALNDALTYCNLAEPTEEMEPFIRKKVKSIINYEAETGNAAFDIKTIKEGDTSITYNVDANFSRETIYGLSDRDKKELQRFRRLKH